MPLGQRPLFVSIWSKLQDSSISSFFFLIQFLRLRNLPFQPPPLVTVVSLSLYVFRSSAGTSIEAVGPLFLHCVLLLSINEYTSLWLLSLWLQPLWIILTWAWNWFLMRLQQKTSISIHTELNHRYMLRCMQNYMHFQSFCMYRKKHYSKSKKKIELKVKFTLIWKLKHMLICFITWIFHQVFKILLYFWRKLSYEYAFLPNFSKPKLVLS